MAFCTRLGFPLLAGLLLAAAGDPSSPVPRLAKADWVQRHQDKLQEIHQGPVDMILLGDSIIQELEVPEPSGDSVPAVSQQFYSCRHAVNLGFGGDTTSNLLWRIENGEVDGIHPKLAVVMVGTNNIRPKLVSTADETAAGIVTVVTELHQRLPDTHILLLGIPPSTRDAESEQKRATVNQMLASHGWAGQNVTFLSVDPALSSDGAADPNLFWGNIPNNMVHPNQEGWSRIATLIEPTVSQLLGQPDHGEPPCGS